MASSQWVIDVQSATFQEQVVDQSGIRPVVVDFWAPWCAPCRALGPALEALAVEKDGGFLLAKVNTDENPDLAEVFQVEGIPAVFAIHEGKMVDRFEGVLPEADLRRFIEKLPLSGGSQSREPTPLELEGRDPKAAIAAYRAKFTADPNDPSARVGLARVLLVSEGQEEEAAALLAPIEIGDDAVEADRLRTIIKLREVPHSEAELASARSAAHTEPENASARLKLAAILAARGDYQLAMDELLAVAENDKALGLSSVRALMVEIFGVIGPRSPEADDYRVRLQRLLY